MALVSITTELDEAKNFLDGLKEDKWLQKNLLTTVAQKTRQKVRSSYSSYLNKQAGTLYNSIKYKVAKKGTSAAVYPGVKYGFMLAHGYDVVPKTDFLTFKIGDKWIRTYGPITVGSKNFVEEPANTYLTGLGINYDLEERMQKEVKRIEKINAKKGITK